MLQLKNVLILGDSYSTCAGYIPEGYATWYYEQEVEHTDVKSVEETWWYPLMKETNGKLLMNNSWSGTTICNTGYDGVDATDSSFITRFDALVQQGYFMENTVDTLLVFGGTNDSWAGAPIGQVQYGDWTKEDLFKVLPAFCYLLHRAKTVLPKARIVAILNTELNEKIGEGFAAACANYGVKLVVLENIGKTNGHPNVAGMRQIKEQIKGVL